MKRAKKSDWRDAVFPALTPKQKERIERQRAYEAQLSKRAKKTTLGHDPETHAGQARVMERELRKTAPKTCDQALEHLDVAVSIREHRISGGVWAQDDNIVVMGAKTAVRKLCGCKR